MRHNRRSRKFDRHTSHRQAMLKNLAKNLLTHQKIETTLVKAKEARRLIEKLITWSKEDSLKNRRLVYNYLQNRTLVRRLFVDLAPLFKERAGGYTRIIRTVHRAGDGCQMAVLELVSKIETPKKAKGGKFKEKEVKKEVTPIQEKTKPKIKPSEKITHKKELDNKKGIVSGLKKYFGGDKKGK